MCPLSAGYNLSSSNEPELSVFSAFTIIICYLPKSVFLSSAQSVKAEGYEAGSFVFVCFSPKMTPKYLRFKTRGFFSLRLTIKAKFVAHPTPV